MRYVIADFVARHAVVVLVALAIALLALSAAAWRMLTTAGPRTWLLATNFWNRARDTRLAHRLRHVPMLGWLLRGTLTIARYFGIVAIIAAIASVGAMVLFFEVADEIRAGETLAEFDIALSTALREHLAMETLSVFAIITRLGDPEVLVAIASVVFAVLAVKRAWLLAVAWAGTTLGGAFMNRVLKSIFERTRPLHDHGLTLEGGWSFPSGHASGSMLVYGLLAYLIVRNTPSVWHLPVALTGAAIIVFVGSSRVLLQVHYLSDVLGGYAGAAVWLGICIAALEAVRWRRVACPAQL
jgi:membrane-associated phospholipid phosphatase